MVDGGLRGWDPARGQKNHGSRCVLVANGSYELRIPDFGNLSLPPCVLDEIVWMFGDAWRGAPGCVRRVDGSNGSVIDMFPRFPRALGICIVGDGDVLVLSILRDQRRRSSHRPRSSNTLGGK